MVRCLLGVLLLIGAGGCNTLFGIPEAQPGNIDECKTGLAACDANATCTDMPGSYTCACNAGFEGDGKTCSDVNECAAATSPCDAHAACSNSPGSFTCTCAQNFVGDGTTYCAPSTFNQIAPAGGFSCGLGGDGGIYCWGNNTTGQLGDGTFVPHARPRQVGTATDWIGVGARRLKACGLRSDHSLWCWGSGVNGALGNGTLAVQPSPVKVVSDKPAVGWKAFAVGLNRVCGIHDDGGLACWGLDNVASAIAMTPVAIGVDLDWTQVSVGAVICGLRNTTGGNLFCFGKTNNGELGLGAAVTSQATPARVGTAVYSTVGVGYFNSCAVTTTGALFCWGNNPNSQGLQYGNTPTQVGTATDWTSITSSSGSMAGVRAGGAAFLWGDNRNGQTGIAQLGDVLQPTPLSGTATGWSAVVASNGHACGITAGKAYCWGATADGELGEGSVSNLYAPTRIGSDTWSSVVTGFGGVCGIRSDNALLCWGYNFSAGLGFGNPDPVPPPTRLGMASWSAIGTSNNNSFLGGSFCGVRAGSLACWGENSTGQIGIGNTVTPQLAPVPVSVPAATDWTEVSTSSHTCAIQADGALLCWGANSTGQLGNNAPGQPVPTPLVTLPGPWLHVGTAGFNGVTTQDAGVTCGIRSDHTLWCWGLDNTVGVEHDVPTQVGTDADWATLSVKDRTICAIKLNGALFCRGEWSDGTANPSPTLTRVGGPAVNWKAVSVGNESCGVRGDGTLWCWGNANGVPLGDGNTGIADPIQGVPAVAVPTLIGTDTDWASVSTRGFTSCATKANGSLWCWGFDAAITPQIKTVPAAIN